LGALRLGSATVGILVLGTGCSLNPYSDHVNVRLDVAGKKDFGLASTSTRHFDSLSRMILGPQANMTMAGPPGFTVDGFDCLIVNIEGPGIPMIPDPASEFMTSDMQGPSMGNDEGPESCKMPSIYSDLVDASEGGEIELVVPSGPSRNVQVIGVSTPDGGCPIAGLDYVELVKAHMAQSGTMEPMPYMEAILGESQVDLFADSTVEVINTFDNNAWRFPFGCHGDQGGGYGPGVLAMAATKSTHSTCVVRADGQVRCWGDGSFGQLGGGNVVTQSLNPVTVLKPDNTPLAGVVDIRGGGQHFCALTSWNELYCWGNNSNGQIGIGTLGGSEPYARLLPPMGGTVADFDLGSYHSCAVNDSGAVYCWGSDSFGQQGNSTPTGEVSSPAMVSGLGFVSQVALGGNTTCVNESGSAKCWGSDNLGMLGNNSGTQVDVNAPPGAPVSLPDPVLQLAAGPNTVCAVLVSGAVHCWGGGASGQMGNGSYSSVNDGPVPSVVDGIAPGYLASKVSVGTQHVCAMASGNVMICWGEGNFGQLGNGTVVMQAIPVYPNIEPVLDIAMGMNFSCAIYPYGPVCWGENTSGQLGLGDTAGRNVPTPVTVPF
jgi:alpha-tubulin suppressor-like RCC1 family protein